MSWCSTMNRAAEAAVPEAKQLFVDSVKKMTVQDAKGILTGGETAGTEYFKRTTSDQLQEALPAHREEVHRRRWASRRSTTSTREQGAAFGLVKQEHANLDDYVTQKALDGLYFMVAEEEKKIRKDPVGTASSILKKVFGALKIGTDPICCPSSAPGPSCRRRRRRRSAGTSSVATPCIRSRSRSFTCVELVLRHFQHQLVVHLHDELGGELLLGPASPAPRSSRA